MANPTVKSRDIKSGYPEHEQKRPTMLKSPRDRIAAVKAQKGAFRTLLFITSSGRLGVKLFS